MEHNNNNYEIDLSINKYESMLNNSNTDIKILKNKMIELKVILEK
ncbi:4150_t:CDS:1, partial [Cetraspora pellucida]